MTDGQQLRDFIGRKLKQANLTQIQKADLQSASSGAYEPDNIYEVLSEIDDMLNKGQLFELIQFYKKLPSSEGDNEGIKVRMGNGKVIPLNQYMNLFDNAFLKGNPLPEVKEFIGSDIPDSSSYSKLNEEEYRASAFGGLNYTNGLVSGISHHAFRFVKEDLYREEILEVDKVYTLEEWQELMNSLHPCMMASYFYSSDIVLKFFAYLEDEYIIFNPGGGKVLLNFEDMCSHFK